MRTSTILSAASFLVAFVGALGFTGGNFSLELGAGLLILGLVGGFVFGLISLSQPVRKTY